MGKQSTRENKTIYQLCREAQGLTREKASELMPGLSASRIEKFEYELQEPQAKKGRRERPVKRERTAAESSQSL